MKKFHIIGIALVAVFAFSAIASSTAFAIEPECSNLNGANRKPKYATEAACLAMEPEEPSGTWYLTEPLWLINGQDIPTGQSWNANQTLAAGTLLLLEDMKEGVDVLCEGTGLIWLLPEGKDLRALFACSKSVTDTGTCEGPSIEELNLSWTTVLEQMTTGVWLDKITKGTGGEPGWLVECTIPLIGRINDECVTNNGTVIVTNNETNGTIEWEFPEATEAKAEQTNCSLGGKEEGLVVGKFITEALNPAGVKQTVAVSLD
jgi:hypothetical protein